MNYILERLAEIEDVGQRRAEADRLCSLENSIPTGTHNPPMWYCDGRDYEVKHTLRREYNYFKRLRKICEGKLPPSIKQSYDLFCRNAAQVKFLLERTLEERRELPIHNFFPFCFDFNGEIHKIFSGVESDLELDKIIFDSFIVGRGGFAMVYPAHSTGGEKYALKLFYPEIFESPDPACLDRRMYEIRLISENLKSQQELWKRKPFLAIRAFSGEESGYFAFIRDYAKGDSVLDILQTEPEKLTPKLNGRILFVYAEMLCELHSQNKVFIDHGWDEVIVSDDDNIGICDFDFVTPVKKLEKGIKYPSHTHFCSREYLTNEMPTFSGDLESFALMAHRLLLSHDYLKRGDDDSSSHHARENRRAYPAKARDLLPKPLREIMPALISYPRDNSIKALDFFNAIKASFNL